MRILTSLDADFFHRVENVKTKIPPRGTKTKKKSIETGEIIFAFPPKLNELTISIGSPSFVETRRLNSPFLPAEVPLSKHLTPSLTLTSDPSRRSRRGRRGDRTHRSITLL